MTKPTSSRRPRRWWKILAGILGVILLAIGALPWLLATSPGQTRIAAGLNRAVAPGRLEVESVRLSWFGPTRLFGVILFDPKGDRVARVPTAILDQALGSLIFGNRKPLLLTLDEAALEVERSADGSINLAKALQTIVASPDPLRDITIRIERGTLRYRDPFLAEPSTANRLDLTLRVPTSPHPVSWTLKLGQGDANLEVVGEFDRWLSKGGPSHKPELQIGVSSQRWPLVAKAGGVDATSRLDGSLDFARKRGRWVLSGDARLLGLNARGKPLGSDSLAFDRLDAGWDLAEAEAGWSIRRLAVDSPLGTVKAEGQLNGPDGSGKQRIEGRLDLAEIARQIPHALRIRDGLTVDRGSAWIAVDLTTDLGQSTYDVEARVSDLVAKDRDRPMTLREPATFDARLIRKGEVSSVERLAVKTSFLEASAKGRLDDGVALEATLDLDGFRKQLGDWIDLGKLDLSGRAQVSGTYRSRNSVYENGLKATIKDFRIEGLTPGSIRRDLATFEATSSGPSDGSGLPSGWTRASFTLKAGESSGRLDLETKADSIGLAALVSTPIGTSGQPRAVQAKLAGGWSTEAKTLAIDDLTLALEPGQVAASTRGKLDLSSGELILESRPSSTPRAIELDPEGLRVSGLAQGLDSLRVEASFSGQAEALDQILAELGHRSPIGLSGRWAAIANAQGDSSGVQVSGKIGLVEPPASPDKPTRPTSLAIRAHYSPELDRLDLSEFTASTAFGTLDASGQLKDPTGRQVVDLKGTLAPDFAAINALLTRKVEPGAKVEGRPRSFRTTGTLGDDASGGWKGLDAEVGFDLTGADIYGMKFGPSPVVLRSKDGKLSIDPISTTLNEGHIRLEPEVDLGAPGGATLRLAKNSAIREARINDEVSKRVLAYVAPVLDQATRASGLVSLDLDHAEFPIGPGRGRQAKVEGAVVFEDVAFAPGPFANEILGVIGRRDLSLKLDQPVTLTIADGRINQRGMAIPIGDLTRIELAGWVDFDRNLAMVATLPVTPAMLGNNPVLSDIVSGTRVSLPIRGTLDKPTIDRDAFAASLQDQGKSLLLRGATQGALDLLMRIGRPRDPNAPPPPPRPSPEERKAMRQEKRAIRRGEIPPPPPDPGRP